MFEKALRQKVRFDSPKGQLTVEDLWDLPLQTVRQNGASLDGIAIALDRQLRDAAATSFVDDAPVGNEAIRLKLELVKYVISVKKAESAAAAARQARAATKDKILGIIEKKKDAALESASIEELQAALASL